MSVEQLAGAASQSTHNENETNRVLVPCAHCGQPTQSESSGSGDDVFCCHGCRGAFELIHGWGLDDFYALRDARFRPDDKATSSSDPRYEAFDEDSYLGQSSPQPQADGTLSTELAVHGLHCAACAWLIESAASRTPGWRSARVKMSDHTIRIFFDPARLKLSQIAALLGRLGYELAPLTSRPDDQIHRENRRLLTQIAVAGFCAANAMWIAIALYAGDASGALASHRDFLRLVGTGLGITAVAIPGRTFFVGATASLRTRTPHMDLPIALGLSIGTIAGVANALTGRGDVYFDSLAVLVFLLLIGRWIQFRQQCRAAKSVDLLLRITPQHANLQTSAGCFEQVLVEKLQPNDIVRVAAGDSVPVDGVIDSGWTLIDRSLLTGESRPVAAAVGDEVSAGMLNLQRTIDVCVTATGAKSRIGQVMQLVEDAMAARTPVIQLADRVGGVFVIVVTLLAAITLLGWLSDGLAVATSHATSLLIVACPCALALATPLAIAVSIGRAAKQRILVRDGSIFQRLSKPGQIWFDKTGTLTEGRINVSVVAGPRDAVALAAAIERECCHPIAEGIVRFAESLPARIPSATDETKVEPGGVSGRCGGHLVVVGNLSMMQSEEVDVDEDLARAAKSVANSGSSPILVALDGTAVAVLEVSDPAKSDAERTVQRLKQIGWKVGILSGDHPETVRRVAGSVGIGADQAIGGLSPEDKLDMVRRGSGETVVMIGDGANDAAALAAADVGIAVRGGAEVSLQAAPVFVSSGVLSSILDLVSGSRRTMRLIGTAFALSLGYNIFAVGLAMTGRITPLIAAILMPISSVTVLSLTLAWPTIRDSNS